MEAKVLEVKELGTAGGAGNLVICEIIKIHISETVLTEENNIDTQKLDLVARMGDNWYCRASGDALFEVKKPITTIGIGFDQIPENIRNSEVLSGNNLGLLGSIEQLPVREEIEAYRKTVQPFTSEEQKQLYAKALLHENKVKEAWMVLL
jgi:hypothetical protein